MKRLRDFCAKLRWFNIGAVVVGIPLLFIMPSPLLTCWVVLNGTLFILGLCGEE